MPARAHVLAVITALIIAVAHLSATADAPRSTHWAFQRIQRPDVPGTPDPDWIRTPVDAFVAAGHADHNLTPAPEASPRTLLRRLCFDLTGLPPTPVQLETFLADESPTRYESLVKRLLASPHYGERWGRHWLDVARFAESEGYETNKVRAHAWRYRDYVVDAFNEDRPYDVFLRQQIAGDELLPYSDENLIATGFHGASRLSDNDQDKARQRNAILVDIVNATASAVIGLTLSCAQCHDHKLEPLTQRDYYRFQGYFVTGQVNHLVLKSPALWKAHEAAIPKALAPAKTLRRVLYEQAKARLIAHAKGKPAPNDQHIKDALSKEDRALLDSLDKKIPALRKQIPPKPQTWGYYSPLTSPTEVDTLPIRGVFAPGYNPDELRKARPHILVRGDPHRPGDEVDIGWPAVFGPTTRKADKPASRTELVNWLVRHDNPLTARVWVNRIWYYHFGRGLVTTPGDFGTHGAKPSHPALLDFLAAELIDSGWSTKHIHRLIVNANTYRQSARSPSAADSDNRYLAHWRPRRLEAEAIRDAILTVSGELDPARGGPSVSLDQQHTSHRRSLYLLQKRDAFPTMQNLFDGPTANESCPDRHVSTVPLQPLFMLNNAFVLDCARVLAVRVTALASEPRPSGPDVLSGPLVFFATPTLTFSEPIPYGVFNNLADQGWIWPSDNSGFLVVDFGTPVELNRFRVYATNNIGARGANWEIEWSQNNNDWTHSVDFAYQTRPGGGVDDFDDPVDGYGGWYEITFNDVRESARFWRVRQSEVLLNHAPRSGEVQFCGPDIHTEIEAAFTLTFARQPDDTERAAAVAFLNDQLAESAQPSDVLVRFCHALLNANEFIYVE